MSSFYHVRSFTHHFCHVCWLIDSIHLACSHPSASQHILFNMFSYRNDGLSSHKDFIDMARPRERVSKHINRPISINGFHSLLPALCLLRRHLHHRSSARGTKNRTSTNQPMKRTYEFNTTASSGGKQGWRRMRPG